MGLTKKLYIVLGGNSRTSRDRACKESNLTYTIALGCNSKSSESKTMTMQYSFPALLTVAIKIAGIEPALSVITAVLPLN